MKILETLPEWSLLKKHQPTIAGKHLRELFTQDPERFQTFSLEAAGLFLDYSKNWIIPETLHYLCQLAVARGLPEKIQALFQGDLVNSTENQPALHPLLRNVSRSSKELDETLTKMAAYAEKIAQKQWKGYTGLPITDIVNIGIGGSHLGPQLVCEALTAFQSIPLRCHFVSNADYQNLHTVLQTLNPETTLFIISSKSFQTKETLLNAKTAQQWLINKSNQPLKNLQPQFLAVTAMPKFAIDFGIHEKNIFTLPKAVGGRYSVWSAIGLPIVLSMGMENFQQFLSGAYAMDMHFISADFSQNMPVILALLGIWQINFFDTKTHAILPYCEQLKKLPAYLQQLEMESNGKSVTQSGEKIHYHTSPVIWGEIGTNGQHAFHQLLHQGTQVVPADFILPLENTHTFTEHHHLLVSSCFSQSQALMQGKTWSEAYQELTTLGYSEETAKQLAPHCVLPGNRPSNTILLPRLTPFSLGALLALYEHKVFTQSVIWDINCFDQWGVELGKQLADKILTCLETNTLPASMDASTKNLIRLYQK